MGRRRGWDQPELWGEELGEGSAWGEAGGGAAGGHKEESLGKNRAGELARGRPP